MIKGVEEPIEIYEAARCLYVFHSQRPGSELPRAFRKSRPVFAMMDYFYEGGVHVTTDFFGVATKTPAGVLKLAERFGYEVRFLSRRGDTIEVIDSFPVADVGYEEATARINRILEGEIRREPARWLLWPNLPHRWGIDVRSAAAQSSAMQ